jgi:hypothetical protein
MRQYVYAFLLVALLEALSLVASANGWTSPGKWGRTALKVSVGFPIGCMSYTEVHTTGDMPSWQNYPERGDWLSGFRIFPLFLILDLLVAAAAFFGFHWLVRYEAGRTASLGFILGSAIGIVASVSQPTRWTIALIWLIGVPTLVCLFTRRARSVWLSILFLAVAALTGPWAYICTERFRPQNGFSFAATSFTQLHASWTDMLFMPAVVTVSVGMLVPLIRRHISYFRRFEPVA